MFNSKNIFVFVLFFITGLNLLWVTLNTQAPYYDSAGHTNRAFEFADILNGKKELENPLEFLSISDYHPPLVLILGGVITSILGYDYKLLEYTSVLILTIAGLVLYLYVLELTKNSAWAAFAAASFIVLPHIWEPSRHFMLDFPLTLFIILSLYALEKFKNTDKALYLFFSFLFLAFAQLTKWYAIVYLAIPFLFAFYQYLKSWGLKKTLNLFFIPAAFSLAITMPWYVVNFEHLLFWTNFFSQPHFGNPENPFTLKNFLFYPTMLLNYQIVSLQFIIFIASCVYFFRNKPTGWLLVALEILLVYNVFTLLGNKNVRFTMPLLPFLAVILGYGLLKISNLKLGRVIVFGFFLFSLSFYLTNSFGFPIKTNFRLAIDFDKRLDNIYFLDLSSRDIPYLLSQSTWDISLIVKDIEAAGASKKRILVVSNSPYLSVAGLDLFNRELNIGRERFSFREPPLDRLETIRDDEIDRLISQYDFILVPDQSVAPPGQQNYFNMDAIRKFILAGKTRDFALLNSYKLPNNDTLYLLKRDPNYNTLGVSIEGNSLRIKRPDAVANIYLQFMDSKFNWSQETINQRQIMFEKDLTGLVRFRIDYSPRLIKAVKLTGWEYDSDKQFDKK